MRAIVLVLAVEAIPIGAFVAVVFSCPLARRSRFWLRFASVLGVLLLPALVAIGASLGEQTGGMLLMLGLPWALCLSPRRRFVLFHGPGPDSGPANEDDDGPGPEDGRPTPLAPIGGIPLPDAEP
jgi:hypothetical protein